MSELFQLILALLAGILFGVIFFGSLLKGATAKLPALWFSISFLLRTSIAVAGFYFVAGAD